MESKYEVDDDCINEVENEWEEIINYDVFPQDILEVDQEHASPLASEMQDCKENTVCEQPRDHQCTSVTRMALNHHKAGMEGLDKEKINQIIQEASRGSKYYENEACKEAKTRERIAVMKEELKQFSEEDLRVALIESNKVLQDVENRRDFRRTLVHIDMDAFYAAVETLDNPSLKDIPMAVGSNSMLCTSNYVARKYGVRAAMPGFIAKKLCPHLVIVPTHFDKYRAISAKVKDVFCEYDPNFSAVSLDEAYLDLTDYIEENFHKYQLTKKYENLSEVIVQEMRSKIFDNTKLTASAGSGCNLMLAKICSDMNKPNGQYYLKPEREVIKHFMKVLPVRKVGGIGRVTEQMLKALDIETCEDILKKRAFLYLLFSIDSFKYFMNVASGVSGNRITHENRKSMSAERTFQNISNTDKLLEICHDICKLLEKDLRKESLKGYNLTLKYKLSSFVTKTRSKTLAYPVSKTEELFKISKELLLKEIKMYTPKKFELRLMGVRVCNFVQKREQKQQTVETLFMKNKQRSEMNVINEAISSVAVNLECPQEIIELKGQELDQLECPVCKEMCEAKSLNTHLDVCLIKTSNVQEHIPTGQESSCMKGSNRNRCNSFEDDLACMSSTADQSCLNSVIDLVDCPVCGVKLKNNLVVLNMHVDTCLNKKTIMEIVKEQDTICCSSSSAGLSHCNNSEKKVEKSSLNLKRKCEKKSHKQNKRITLHTFWGEQ